MCVTVRDLTQFIDCWQGLHVLLLLFNLDVPNLVNAYSFGSVRLEIINHEHPP